MEQADDTLDGPVREMEASEETDSAPLTLDEVVQEIFEIIDTFCWDDEAMEIKALIEAYCHSQQEASPRQK